MTSKIPIISLILDNKIHINIFLSTFPADYIRYNYGKNHSIQHGWIPVFPSSIFETEIINKTVNTINLIIGAQVKLTLLIHLYPQIHADTVNPYISCTRTQHTHSMYKWQEKIGWIDT